MLENVNFFISIFNLKENDSSKALYLGFGICFISFIATILFSFLDAKQDEEENCGDFDSSVIDQEMHNSSFIKILKGFSRMFWLVSILTLFLYGSFLPFNNICSGFLMSTTFSGIKDKDLAQRKAGLYSSIPFFISAFMIPIFGMFIDIFGNRGYLLLLSGIFGLISYSLFFFSIPPIYSLILLGITYSIYASVAWPLVSIVVKKYQIVKFLLI